MKKAKKIRNVRLVGNADDSSIFLRGVAGVMTELR